MNDKPDPKKFIEALHHQQEISRYLHAFAREFEFSDEDCADFVSAYSNIMINANRLFIDMKKGDSQSARKDAIQIGAMALKFLMDCKPKSDNRTMADNTSSEPRGAF